MEEAIKKFPEQFSWEPKIINEQLLQQYSKFVVAGMGGSGLAGDLLKVWSPGLDIMVHRDYGLPEMPEKEWDRTLVIASSYSGNTEETLDALDRAIDIGAAVAVVAAGGKLLERAKETKLPYIQLPETGIQPRMATGYSIKALLALLGAEEALVEISELAGKLNSAGVDKAGADLAKKISGKIPVIYSSRENFPIAYNWKTKFNETAKTPAFANAFPELNHNEMTAADGGAKSKKLSENLCFIFLRDIDGDPRYLKRMDITAKLYQDRGVQVETVELASDSVWEKIFSSTLLADWTAYHLAGIYGSEPEQVPMVEEFKKML
ncbi:MAG: bifunctional phosphoglucose/phosphomannose isomerase [bacterium]|nr:bifunctional phosphoglucose/phosphomannose isomerase [bacterium]